MELINNFGKYFSAVLGRAKRTCQEYTKEVRLFARYMLATYADLEMSEEELLLVASRTDANNYIYRHLPSRMVKADAITACLPSFALW